MSKYDEFHKKVEELCDKHGIPDFCFCGVDIEDMAVMNCRAGFPGQSNSNRARSQRLMGVLQEELAYISYKNLYGEGSIEEIEEKEDEP